MRVSTEERIVDELIRDRKVRIAPVDDDDEGRKFDALIQALLPELANPEATLPAMPDQGSYFEDEFMREDEFTCHGCNLILHRSALADPDGRLCRSCSG